MDDIEGIANEIRMILKGAVYRHPADGLLLSGGIDSSILALFVPQVKALTLRLESFGDDVEYAQMMAQHLGMEHEVEVISVEEAFETIPEVIGALKTYDPHMPNHVAALAALRLAKEKGIKTIMTGDGGDELFAGYSYMLEKEDLGGYIRELAKRMHFSSRDLVQYVGLELSQPYLDQEFLELALEIEPALKVVTEGGKTWGKWILRKAFEDDLPQEVAWQEKRPFELGSGFSMLREFIDAKVSDDEFEEKVRSYPLKFYSKEHLFYYEIYDRIVGQIPPPQSGEKACQGCGGGMPISATHCKICGWVQDRKDITGESFRVMERRQR